MRAGAILPVTILSLASPAGPSPSTSSSCSPVTVPRSSCAPRDTAEVSRARVRRPGCTWEVVLGSPISYMGRGKGDGSEVWKGIRIACEKEVRSSGGTFAGQG